MPKIYNECFVELKGKLIRLPQVDSIDLEEDSEQNLTIIIEYFNGKSVIIPQVSADEYKWLYNKWALCLKSKGSFFEY